jgi:hypothetical protein
MLISSLVRKQPMHIPLGARVQTPMQGEGTSSVAEKELWLAGKPSVMAMNTAPGVEKGAAFQRPRWTCIT